MNRWTSVLLAFGGLIAFPLVDSAIKGTLILVLAAAVCLWLRKDSAATRHFVWTIAIGLLVAMPVLPLVLPQWRILPGWMNSEPVTLREISLPTMPSKATLVEADVIGEPAQPIAIEDLPADMSGDASDALNVPVPMTETSPAGEVSAIGPVEETATTLPAWISVTWLIGCALLLVRLSVAAMMLRRSERRCVVIPCRDRDDRGDWRAGDVSPLMNAMNHNQGIDIPRSPNLHPLASGMRQLPGPESSQSISAAKATEYRPVDAGRSPEELGIALEQSKLSLGLKRPVAVLLDPKRSIPIVWGLWKTRLQLPKEALQWSDEQLQSVLLHELAHVRRRDLFVLALTQIACALHWFNPLVWIAAWRLHVERERACDDLVLNTGIRASSYAEHLLNVATRLTSSQWTQACGLAMARSSSLHGRLSAVLSEKQNRRSVTLAMTIMTLFCSLSVGIPMAMLRGADEVAQETPASQTTEEAKPDAAPDEAPQPIVNNLGSSGNYRPAAILPRIPRTAPTNNRDSTRPLLERLSDDPDQRAKELVYLLRDYRIWIRSDEWAEATRELVKLGDVALPYLIAELDRTDRDQTIRVVAFALRAINNPRAVPALIRAVPKALRPPGSDCGVYVRTKELHEFMSAIDDSPGVDDDVSLGRPVTEIFSALGHLTSHKFGDDDELSSVFLEDPADEAKLRKQFTDRQREWEIWWSEHGPELIPAAELPRWNQASAKTLDAAGRDDIERAGIARFGELFPTGPDVRLGPVRELELSWPGFADSVCAIDFDEHRGIRRFELYDDGGRHFQAVHSGADLSASELVKEYDLCLWHSTNEQWSSIDQDIPKGQQITMVREAHQRTLCAETGQQTYVFLTREGGQGIVQIDELDQSRYTRKIRYRMWNDTDVLASVGLPKPDSPSTVSWSAVHKARLAAPGPQSLSAWSLNNYQAVALPDSTPKEFFERGRSSEFCSSPEFANWMIDKEVSLIFVWGDYTHNRRNLPEDYLKTIRHLPAIQVMNCRRAMLISPDGFDTLPAADAAEFPDGLLCSSMSSDYVPGNYESGTTSTDAAVFHLTDGTVGMFEITNRHAADGAIEFRYKTVVTAKKADGRRVEARSDRTEPAVSDAEENQHPDPTVNPNLVKHPDAHAVLQEGNPERTSEEQAIVASLLASETKRAKISLENSKLDLEAKRSANKELTDAYSASELKRAELEVAEKEAVLKHARAVLKKATLHKNAGGLTGDAKSLAEAKAAVRLAETNIARRRLDTLELTQQLNQAANQKTPGTYTSEEMEKLAVEIEKAKARIAELTGGPTEKPQAAKAPGSQVEQQGDLRIATHPGLFEVGDRVFLWVARKLHPDPDENGASLVRVSKEGKQIATDIPLPSGEGTWAAGWVRGGKVLWVAQKGKVTRYDFSDAEQVQITDETQSSTDAAVPKELNALMQQAIGEDSSKTDASQDASQGHGTEPASPDKPRASLDPIESPSRRIVTWEDLAIDATTLAEIRDEEMALDEVSEDLKTLNGKRIVLRGYMYPTFEATRLKKFVLVSDLFAASFVRKTSIDALVGVRLHDKSVTDFVEGREISVEGILRIDPRLNREGELYQLYQLEDAQILQLHARTSMRKKGILVRPVSAETSQEATLEYRAAFEHGEYDLGGGRTLRVRAIDQQQQSLTIEWPSNEPSQVYSWSMIPEAPHRADFRMSPEKPWSQTTGWGVVWHADSDTVWIADGSERKKLNIAEPTAIIVADSADSIAIERTFREHIGMIAAISSRDNVKLVLWSPRLGDSLARLNEQQDQNKRSTDVRIEAAKLKKISK